MPWVFSVGVVGVNNHSRRPRGGQSGGDKRQRKFSRKGDRTPGILLLTNQFHDLFECLSVIGQNVIFVPNQEPACIVLPLWSSYKKEFTCKLDCFLYAPEKISLARASEFLWEESSVNSKWAPKVYSTSFIRSSCITEEKHLTTNLQTLKAEKMSPARALSLIHIWRCRRSTLCRSRWSPYH